MTGFYESLADHLPGPDLPFFNYGLAQPIEEGYAWIREADRRHKYHLSLVRRVLDGVNLVGKTVLEVSSGRGGNCYYLSQYAKAKRVYGLDLCAASVQFAAKHYSFDNIRFLRGDAQCLPFSDRTFDVVLNLESSHCYPDFAQFLSEVHRVLVPQGIFCFADVWSLEIFPFDWGQREKALDSPSLALLSQEDISEQVFQALRAEDGLVKTLRGLANPDNREWVDRLAQGTEAFRLYLALGECSYKVWRLRRR